MNITKFKLVDEGFGGLQYSGTETRLKDDNTTVVIDINNNHYRVPVPADIVQVVQGLKYFFLICTGLMPDKTDKFFDQEFGLPKMKDYQKDFDRDMYAYVDRIVKKLFITGFSYDGDKIVITAKMKNHDDETFAVNTPAMVLDTVPMGVETDLIDLVLKIRKEVVKFIEDGRLRKMAAKQYLLNLFGKDEDKIAEINAMTEEEAEKAQIEKLEAKGFIVFRGEEVMDEINQTEQTIEPEPVVDEDGETIAPPTKEEVKVIKMTLEPQAKPQTDEIVDPTTVMPKKLSEIPATASRVPRHKTKQEGVIAGE